jgi:hypothetical protein
MAEEQDAPVETFDQYSHSVYSPITPGAHMDSYKVSLRSPRRDGFGDYILSQSCIDVGCSIFRKTSRH